MNRLFRFHRDGLFVNAARLVAVAMVALVAYPLMRMILRVFVNDGRLDLAPFGDVFGSRDFAKTIFQTLVTVGVAGAIALVVGSMLAWINERTDASLGRISSLMPIIPLLVPPIAGTAGWIMLASSKPGLLNVYIRDALGALGLPQPSEGPFDIVSWKGMIFLYVVYLVPYVYLLVAAALQNADPALEEAARVNGAGPLAAFRRVTLPAIKPGLAGAGVLVLVIGFAMYSVPILIGASSGVDILSVRIVALSIASYPPRTGEAIVLGLLVLLFVSTGWIVQQRIAGRGRYGTVGGKHTSRSRVALGRWRWVLRLFVVGYVVVAVVLPATALLLVSFQRYWGGRIDWSSMNLDSWRIISSGGTPRTALWNSVRLGIAGATLGTLVAALVAYYARIRPRGGAVASAVLKVPGAISHIVLGLAFLIAFSGAPFHLQGTIVLLLMAYLVSYMPQASIAAEGAIVQVGRELEEAAAVAGVRAGRTFSKITLRLMIPGLAAGWAVLFVVIAGDLNISQFLASIHAPVVGTTIVDRFNNGSFPQLAAVGLAMTVVNTTVVFAGLVVSRRFGVESKVRRSASTRV